MITRMMMMMITDDNDDNKNNDGDDDSHYDDGSHDNAYLLIPLPMHPSICRLMMDMKDQHLHRHALPGKHATHAAVRIMS